MRHSKSRFAFVLVGCMALAGAAAAPVAMVTDLQGAVSSDTGALELLSELEPGAVLMVPEGAALRVVFLASGREYNVSGPADLTIETDSISATAGNTPQVRELLADASHAALASVGDLQEAAVIMRNAGAAQAIKLKGPLGGRVLVAPPTLEWEKLAGVENWRVRITDYRGRALLDERVQGTAFTLPPGLRLVPGATYTWSVEARLPDGGRETGFAEFALCDADLRDEALRIKPDDDAAFSERLVYALWLESNELFQEADRYWAQLARERPDSARLRMLADRTGP